MLQAFELFVAIRYLTARRKQAVISVITLISVAGVTAGVMALVIAMAVTTGFRSMLQDKLLGATPHVAVMERDPSSGIPNWRELTRRYAQLPGVKKAAPALYSVVMFTGPLQAHGGNLKGILGPAESPLPDALVKLKTGRFTGWDDVNGYPPIILGWRLAESIGMKDGAVVRVMSPQGEMTPFGPKLVEFRFRVIGTFDSGFYDFDQNWAFTSLGWAQKVLSLPDVVNAVELNIADVYNASEIARQAERLAGPKLSATHWMELNRQFLTALQFEKKVVGLVIFLIQMVAALNIVIALVMMTMEKQRDIGILMSMGATRRQVSKIFILQGALIGVVGTALGMILGHAFCALANRFELIQLDSAVYSISYVPFEPRPWDSLWIVALALVVSFLATIYPARAAARIQPAVSLRYE